jgi:hypothetical protein
MKISEKQIYQLFHIVHGSCMNTNVFGGMSQQLRKEFIKTIVDQQSNQIVDTRDFELMKLASDENKNS